MGVSVAMKTLRTIIGMAFLAGCLVLPAWGSQQNQQAQQNAPQQTAAVKGIVSDWSNHHLIFSRPSSPAVLNKVQHDPRYLIQQISRNRQTPATSAEQQIRALDAEAVQLVHSWGRPLRSKRTGLVGAWGEALGTTATTITNPTYPALFVANPASPDCTHDFIVFTMATQGSATQFNIIAFNNLYVNGASNGLCPGTRPTVLFAYNASTSTTNSVLNGSPVVSLDGTQIAFLESQSSGGAGNQAHFHVLKWHAGDHNATFPDSFVTGNTDNTLNDCVTHSAVAPCQYDLYYNNDAGTGDTAALSSPFIDYIHDRAYVSDDDGDVYAIAPVFGATPGTPPAGVTGWPVNTGGTGTRVMTPPVYDSTSQNVLVMNTSTGGTTPRGLFYIRTATGSSGTCQTGTAVPCLGHSTFSGSSYMNISSGSIVEAPIVDSSTGRVYVFSNGDIDGGGDSTVIQSNVTLTTQNEQELSTGTSVNIIRLGTFNNAYITGGPTGSGALLYACGQHVTGANSPSFLYGFPFNVSGDLLAATSQLNLSSSTTVSNACSSLTENPVTVSSVTTDWLFVGVSANCLSGEATGCIMNFNITSGAPGTFSAHSAEVGGTTGITIDTTATSGTSTTANVYFRSLGSDPSCPDYNGVSHTQNCLDSLVQSGLN